MRAGLFRWASAPWLVPCILFLAAFAVFNAFVAPAASPLDVGFAANSALRIVNGQVPYRDFFALVTPLSFYINAAIVAVFGSSIQAINVGAAVIASATYTIIYLLARRFMPVGWCLATWLAAMVFSPAMEGVATAYSLTATTLALAGVLLFIVGQDRERRRLTAAAGVMFGLCFWTKQTIGAYALLALAAFFLLRWRHRSTRLDALASGAGWGTVTLLFVGYLASRGALGDFVRDCFITPFHYFTAEARLAPPSLRDLGWDVEGLEPLVYFVAIGVVILSLSMLLRQRTRGELDPAYLLLTLISASLLMITRERYSFHNLLCVTPPVFILLMRAIRETWSGHRRSTWVAIASACAVLLFCGLGLRYGRYFWRRIDTASPAARLAFARTFFETHRGSRIVVLPCAPLYYFAANASNPTRFDLVIPGNLSPVDKLEFSRDLETRVDYVLFDEFWRFDHVGFADYNRSVLETLTRDFEPVADGPQGQIVYARRR